MSQIVPPALLASAFSFEQYLQWTDSILQTPNKPELYSGELILNKIEQKLAEIKLTKDTINIDQKLYNTLSDLNRNWTWLLIAEPWCGDVAQTLPVLNAMASCSDKIDLKIILRDSNPDLVKSYLPQGGNVIPKLICLDTETLEEIGYWWYKNEPLEKLQPEFIDLIKDWKNK